MHYQDGPMATCVTTLSSQKEWDRIRQFTQHNLSDPDIIEAVDQVVIRTISERQLVYCADDGMGSDGSISLAESPAISGDAVPDSFEIRFSANV